MNATHILRRLLFLCLTASAPAWADPADAFWPQWRGPLCSGAAPLAAPLANPPLTWSETNNVQWKTAIPGEGDASPIVWGDRVFLLSAVTPTGQVPSPEPSEALQFTVLCLDRSTGKILWQKVARQEVPHEGRQDNNTFASASPVTDGSVVLAFFGSRGLHCYDFDGALKWKADFGQMKTRMGFGEGSSPALSGDTVVIYWDGEGDGDFIAALDKRTGKELWRTPRDEATGWSTPLIVDVAGRKQVVVNATKAVRSYDLATGQEIWSCSGQTANAIPSPRRRRRNRLFDKRLPRQRPPGHPPRPLRRPHRRRRHPLEPP